MRAETRVILNVWPSSLVMRSASVLAESSEVRSSERLQITMKASVRSPSGNWRMSDSFGSWMTARIASEAGAAGTHCPAT